MKNSESPFHFLGQGHAALAAIVETSDDAILSKDLNGTITTWNRAAEALYGYAAEEIIGKSVAILMPPDRPEEFTSIMGRLKRGERIDHYDTVRIHKDGHRIEVSVSVSPVADSDGNLIGAASIAREIGERKRLETERREAADRMARLQRVTAALAETLTPDDVAAVVVRQSVNALGAWAGLIGLVENGSFRVLNAMGYDAALVSRWQTFPLSEAFPISDVVRSMQPVWIESRDDYLSRYPALEDAIAPRTASAAYIPLLARGRTIGVLVLSFESAQVFDAGRRGFVQALAQQCAQALERTRLFEAERQARQDAEDARRRSAFLAEASVALSSSLHYETTLTTVANLVVPHMADWCVVHLREGDSVQPVAMAHVANMEAAWAADVQEGYLRRLSEDQWLERVLATGETVVYNGISDDMLVRASRDEEHLRVLRASGLSAVLMAPLIARDRTIGVLTLIRRGGAAVYSAADQAQGEDLARRCALAVDNARLFHEAQALNRAKDEFQAMLAHELRNPIGAISNALLLLDGIGSGEPVAVKYRGIASRQIQHVVRLLDDLLDVSRITRGKIRLRLGLVSLPSVVESALQASGPVIARRGHRLVVQNPSEPLYVQGDADRLDQVVRNLLDNAAKYTPAGGTITVSTEREGSNAVIRVRDNGAGIPADLLPRIFELFTQADRSLDRAEGGLGIGLTLVKTLTELHGGTIHARSEGPGCGSEFIVRLPASRRPQAQAEAGGPELPSLERAPQSDRRVLLVEDNADAAETLTEILETWGYTVRAAPNGPAALELFGEDPPDVVLLDIGLPGMDGFEVGRRLRSLAGGPETTVVALSGYSQTEDRARSEAAGFDEHLAKPVDLETLLRILQNAPRRRGST